MSLMNLEQPWPPKPEKREDIIGTNYTEFKYLGSDAGIVWMSK